MSGSWVSEQLDNYLFIHGIKLHGGEDSGKRVNSENSVAFARQFAPSPALLDSYLGPRERCTLSKSKEICLYLIFCKTLESRTRSHLIMRWKS